MKHPLVDMAYKKYLNKSYIRESLLTKKAFAPEDKYFIENADKLLRDIEKHPHAFVLACLMDTGVDSDVAWTIPYRVFEKLGTFDIKELYKIDEQEYVNMFSGKKKWHRYPAIKASVFYNGVRKIKDSVYMNGDASRIWSNKPKSCNVILRFLDFKGCGFKVANMAAGILHTHYGIEFSDYSFIDVAPDVHVLKVFQRLGLTPYVPDGEIARIYTIAKARELNPEFPGLVNSLCWEVGREYCSPQNPRCQSCPFSEFCMKDIVSEPDIWV
ncbi:hypothetical protein OXPF_02360 [Oxobacter pfennigii]|uniref:Iron-sulfur cluster loop n=1 Tax=Oxobacter pfennigii TaxID=36849 RepID=A0A0P8Z1Y0_9CLOT|nr:hypothetical protein [Oxobacter pfennigii]KPU46126.1 hypothetical protein OXPF_02360 [Oxobacter pfennigii]